MDRRDDKLWINEMSSKGFTLIELVLVLVLIGILSSYAVVRFPDKHEFLLRAQAELLLTHIRQSQRLASTWHQPLRMNFTGNTYTVSCVTASSSAPCNSSPVIDPRIAAAFSVSLDSAMSLSGASYIDFDTFGRPVSSGALLSVNTQISLSMGGQTNTVIIQPVSGYADLQ